MKVLLLIRDRDLPSSRYRVIQFLPHLDAAGMDAEVAEIPESWRARRKLFRRATGFDAVLLQKKLLGSTAVRLLRRNARRLVFDFDDAILYRNDAARHESPTRRRRFAATVGAADLIIAGNAFLEEIARPFAREIVRIPTVIEPAKYDQAVAAVGPDESRIVLGWIGSQSTVRQIELLRNVFEQLHVEHDNLSLRLICDTFPQFGGLPVERIRWSAATEAQALAGIDIGLAPCNDDPWSKGKCGLKLLQYLAVSRPVVCSPVGAQKEIVRDGLNGHWAARQEDWVERLERLIASPELRLKMGRAGRNRLQESYTVEAAAPYFMAALSGSGWKGVQQDGSKDIEKESS